METGDNYLAKMYRVDVDLKVENGVKQESYVIKSLENLNPMVSAFGIVDTEKEIYSDVLPAFNKIWADVGKSIKFGPK